MQMTKECRKWKEKFVGVDAEQLEHVGIMSHWHHAAVSIEGKNLNYQEARPDDSKFG